MEDFGLTKEEQIASLDTLEKDCARAIFQITMQARSIRTIDEQDKRLEKLEETLKKLQAQIAFFKAEKKSL